MSDSQSALPFDIIGNIIDCLTKDNAKDLQSVKACSLVCQSFLLLCRPHIFSSIEIKITGSEPDEQLHNTKAFGQLLLKTPEIARFIRHLNIIVVDPRARNLFDPVPQQLTRLQSLAFRAPYPWSMCILDWNKIPSSIVQRSLLNLVHLPTVTHLRLGQISNFPISYLVSCTNLKHLSAESLYIALGGHDDSSSPSHGHMQLQDLDIKIFKRSHGSEVSLLTARRSDGRTVLDFSSLEKISVTFFLSDVVVQTREIFRMTQQLTEVRLKSKEILNIRFTGSSFVFIAWNDVFQELGFAKMVTPSLQKLKRVHLTFAMDVYHGDPLAGLCEELEEISGKNKLESIEIVIDLQANEVCHTGDKWGKLERVLLQPGWPMLKHVSLSITLYRKKYNPLKAALERLRETQFARLMSSKNLDFQFSIFEEGL
jgi:hypothetical protein